MDPAGWRIGRRRLTLLRDLRLAVELDHQHQRVHDNQGQEDGFEERVRCEGVHALLQAVLEQPPHPRPKVVATPNKTKGKAFDNTSSLDQDSRSLDPDSRSPSVAGV